MVVSKLLKLWYGVTVLYGLLSALLPRRALGLSLRAWNCGLENVSELEPRPWYVRATRAVGVGMIATGLVGFVLEQRASTAAAADDGREVRGNEPVTVEVGSDDENDGDGTPN